MLWQSICIGESKQEFMHRLLLFLPFVMILNGCTKSVDSDDLKDEVPYYQGYEVAYDLTENTTSAAAWYTVRTSSGSKVELSGDANVKVNGIAAGTSSIDKTRYTWSLTGNPDVEFLLTKNLSVKIPNLVKRADIGNVAFKSSFPASISKANGFSFYWDGWPLESNESLTVSITNKVGIGLASKSVTDSKITFNATELTLLTPDEEVYIELTRARDKALITSDADAGGKIQLRVSNSIKVLVAQ